MCSVRTASITTFVQEQHGKIVAWWVIRREFDDVAGELYDEDQVCQSPRHGELTEAAGASALAIRSLRRYLNEASTTV